MADQAIAVEVENIVIGFEYTYTVGDGPHTGYLGVEGCPTFTIPLDNLDAPVPELVRRQVEAAARRHAEAKEAKETEKKGQA